MTPSSGNNSFTAEDIERYHSGKMSAAEMHAMEKAALDDPFLADALEGYQYAATPSKDIQNLHARLDERTGKKTSATVISMKKTFMRAAVILLVVAGGGWLAYQGLKQSPESIAKAPVELRQTLTVPSSSDSIASTTIASGNVAEKDQMPAHETKHPAASADHSINKTDQRNRSLVASPDELVLKDETKQNISTDSVSTRNNTFTAMSRVEGQATEKKNLESSNAAANAKNNNKAEPAAPMANARKQETKIPDTIRNVDVVLQDNPRPLAEVVLGKGKRKEAEEKGRLPRVVIDTLEPSGGYVQFDDYIANNLKSPDELKMKPIAGEVQLSFDVNQNGEPVNIQVVKSLCEKCDEEAVRLLKEGPKWKQKKNKKGKLTIHF